MRTIRGIFLTLMILLASFASAQVANNVQLFGTLNPEPIHYAGCWGYEDENGHEYALIGAYTGLSIISIDDSENIYEVDFIPGSESNWREITVLGNHAFVASEGSESGMQVIDLSPLPDSASLVTTYFDTFTRSHMIGRDIYSDAPYVYVMGTNSSSGVHIMDVSAPAVPAEAGVYAPTYAHDAHIRGDLMFVAQIGHGSIDIVDIADKSNPQHITWIDHPDGSEHSSWTSADGSYLIVTHESDGLTAKIWDIRDLEDIELLAEYSANTESLVHNPYGLGDLVFFSHNTEGMRILDIKDPSLPVEVGFFDTWPGSSGGFNGLWSAYPYFSSGKIIGGNRHDGLYVWTFNQTRAGRIYGLVQDPLNGQPIPAAQVSIENTGEEATTGLDGRFKFGMLPGLYTITVSAEGYQPQTLTAIELAGEDSLWFDIDLDALTSISIDPTSPPSDVVLTQNYPNPFNPTTDFGFRISDFGWVEIHIFDVQGRLIKTVVSEQMAPGNYTVSWDSRDNQGNAVTSGAYFYRLRIQSTVEMTRKMILLR